MLTNDNSKLVVVTGAGGFIGGSLVSALRSQGYKKIRAVDVKPFDEWYQRFDDVENLRLDLNLKENCETAARGAADIYNLAANMGGMGFIENNKALCMLSVLINTHMLQAASEVRRAALFLFLVGLRLQRRQAERPSKIPALKEEDAYPALPEDGYGWEKLFSERMCRHFREDFGLDTRVARFHNVYGPCGTWDGGREKAPAAICRKVIEAKQSRQSMKSRSGAPATRRAASCIIDDCIKGVDLIMNSDILEPINLGSSELVTINQLVDHRRGDRRIKLKRNYDLERAQGRQWPQQRQHAHQEISRLGAQRFLAVRFGENISLDPRSVHGSRERRRVCCSGIRCLEMLHALNEAAWRH